MRTTKIILSDSTTESNSGDTMIINSGLRFIDNNEGIGKLFTSDNIGNVSWNDPQVTNERFTGYTATTEQEISLKADVVNISGTHTETVEVIGFSTVQGKIITLTDDRLFIISGLTSSNPVGILAISHSGFTPSFSGVTVLDSLVDKSGVYYLKFTIQADGTIIQTNQSSNVGGIYTETNTPIITSPELLDINTTPVIIKTAPGVNLADDVLECSIYIDFKVAYTTYTTLNLFSGNILLGSCDCLGKTSSGWVKFIMVDGASPEINATLSIQALTGDPLVGTSAIALNFKSSELDMSIWTFPTSELLYDNFPTGAIDEVDNWDLVNTQIAILELEQVGDELNATVKTTAGTTVNVDKVTSQASTNGICSVALDFVSSSELTSYNAYLDLYVDDNNRATLYQKDSGGNAIYSVREGGTHRFIADCGVTLWGRRWKITRDAANRFRFYYYNSGWIEIDSGTDKTYNIGTTLKGRISPWVQTGGAATGSMKFDRFRFDDALYSTELPD